ncbi:glycogenin-1-like isoform X2 [Xenia sp. Carnegie-2017]|uniref:glycogenin-1-like isoform X2 n=1 Tax=Xenia sp. Carnegie-2017 TaxID=2897299 RepID=UPI001F03563E|nr:glycogenin-1-like isoform X2 [Xenia sp. Carnegie-2017]
MLKRWLPSKTYSYKRVFFYFVFVIFLFVVLRYLRVFEVFNYGIAYMKIILFLLKQDNQHYYDIMLQEAHTLWNLHVFQKKYMSQWCQDVPSRNNVTWLITLNNDDLATGAVTLGYILRRFSCQRKLTALVTKDLSRKTRNVLAKVGYNIVDVQGLDCNWMDQMRGIPPKNTGIPGTHTRFHAWKMEQYEKIIYVDTDFLPLVSIDELFDIPSEFSAVYHRQPGIFDTCFNAGILVFRPSKKVYKEIIKTWKEMTDAIGCPHDQRVLWYYFAFQGRWNPLPYAYNVWRLSFYPLKGIWSPLVRSYKVDESLYYPMKAYHFAGFGVIRKPWEVKKRPSRKEAAMFSGPLLKREDTISLWWQMFYEAIDVFGLDDWWKKTKVYHNTT